MHEVPHEVSAVSETQAWPHACCIEGHEQVLIAVLHVAPEGQSLLRRQPARHIFETGSHE